MNKHIMQGDPDAAVRFLRVLRPGGPWNLLAIVPDEVGAEALTFTDAAKARTWIAERDGVANIYFTRSPAAHPTGRGGRALKKDIPLSEGPHIDIDADELGHISGDPERKARAVAKLGAFVTPPTFIIDSGGGVQALWQLIKPTDDIRLVERINEELIRVFGGDRGTHDVGRPLRLPGTMNLPNAAKRERGQVEAIATVIEATGRTCDVWEFDVAPPRERQGHQGGTGGELTPAQLGEWLVVVDPRRYREYGAWISVSAASHRATDGLGFDAWADWCLRDPDYADVDHDFLESKWESFTADREGRRAGIGTLRKAVSDAGRSDLLRRFAAIEDFRDEQASAPIEDKDIPR